MQSLKKKGSHIIWSYFIVNSDKSKIKCNLCDQAYEYKTSVSNLKKHFEKYHNDEYKIIKEKHKLKLKKKNTSILKQQNIDFLQNNQETIEQESTTQSNITDFISSKDQNIINADLINNLSKSILIDNGGNKQNFQITSENITYNILANKIKIIYE